MNHWLQKGIVCVCILFFYPLIAQNSVEGYVYDEAQQPIENVQVLVNSSSRATKTDDKGFFRIDFPNGQHNLVFRHDYFQTKILNLQSNQTSMLKVVMDENIIELETAEIQTMSPKDWEYYYTIFQENFLGLDEAAKKCKIKNPKVLRFHFDEKQRILTARAQDALVVENAYLGYEVEYDLQEFSIDYKQQYLMVLGSSFFKELEGSKARKKQWQKNREKAYAGSLTHFLSSLYHQQLEENGFDVKRYIRKENPAYAMAIEKMKMGEKGVVIPSKEIAFLINQKVPYDSLIVRNNSSVFLDFDGLYSFEYQKEKEDLAYVTYVKRGKYVGNQVSIIRLKKPVEITKEGFYIEAGDIILEQYLTWEKFAHLLPVDYAIKKED